MAQEREHTKYSPSRSEQFLACPGCINLLARVPAFPRDEYAIEGDMGHHVLETALKNKCTTATQAVELSDYACGVLEQHFNNDATKIREFKASVQSAIDYVGLLMDQLFLQYGDELMYVETRVDPPVESAPGEAAGYCDVAIVSAKARHLWVIDYKHGVGIVKAVEGNTQATQYAAGFVYGDNSPIASIRDQIDTVTLVIIQPRAFHKDGETRQYDMPVTALVDYLMELDAGIVKCQDPKAPLVVNVEKQCRMCDARDVCPALEAAAANALVPSAHDMRGVGKLPDVASLDPQRLAYLKTMKPTVMAMFDAVEKRIEALLFAGNHVPGHKLVTAKAQREWHEEDHIRAQKLAALIDIPAHELYETNFMAITTVEKMVVEAFKSRVGRKHKKQAAEDARQMFAYFTTKKSSGKLTVATDDDPRPAVDRVASAFAGVNIIPPPSPTNT